GRIRLALCTGIAIAQYLCGLATVTSASRMAFAFARDGGLPMSRALRRVSPAFGTPAIAIWTVSIASIAFTIWTPAYSTITAVCVIFLYIAYVVPSALGFFAYGKSWTTMGPWHLGAGYRALAATATIGCIALIVIGVQPPNDKARFIVGGSIAVLAIAWFGI